MKTFDAGAIRAASPALLAALLFGASTPFAKRLGSDVSPLLLAGLLYAGSGLGLAILLAARRADGRQAIADILRARRQWPWLGGAIVAGGIAGPALWMVGLVTVPAASASLLLNLEAVFTAAIAWWVFQENADRRIVAGMAAIVLGGILLSWQPGETGASLGSVSIAAACLAWAVDNNLTRKVANQDAMLVACIKGLAAGAVNTTLGLLVAPGPWPPPWAVAAALAIGFLGVGLSLTLFVVSLRGLGTARTAAYFSVAPLVGVVISFALWPQWPALAFWPAAALMAAGVWLHLAERHEHEHRHEALEHTHPHRHDEHHRHSHDFAWDGSEPHVHPHAHVASRHSHPHYPDIHHRHGHP